VGKNAPAPTAGTIISYGSGCQAFTKELRRVVWPPKFYPEIQQRFDGTANPIEFLPLYTISIEASGGNDKCMANWFSMAFKGASQSWLMNLPEESISSSGGLCKQFVANFRGMYECPLTKNNLHVVYQCNNPTFRTTKG
jgi:hypothetical protein